LQRIDQIAPIIDPQPLYAVLPSRSGLLDHFEKHGVKAVEDATMSSSPYGRFSEHYAPGFEVFHTQARVLLKLGITSQAEPSLQRLTRCQKQAAFSGLWEQLDSLASHCGLLQYLELTSLSARDAVSLTSRLVFPIFRAGSNYRIGAEYVRTPWLIEAAGNHLGELTSLTLKLRAAIFLGDGQAALASARAHMERGNSANNGRISRFLDAIQNLDDVRLLL